MINRKECKSLEEIILASQEEHRLIDAEKAKIEFDVKFEMKIEGHQAVAMRDMIHTACLNVTDKKKESELYTKLCQKMFEVGFKSVWHDYQRITLKELGKSNKVVVIDSREAAQELLKDLKKDMNSTEKQSLINRLESHLKEE